VAPLEEAEHWQAAGRQRVEARGVPHVAVTGRLELGTKIATIGS
jgi:hypothetical protein